MTEKITLQDIVNLLVEKQGINKKEAELLIKSMFDLIEEALATDKYVKIKGLGTFKLTEVDSRESVNVNTGERIEIQGHTKISFTPDTTMKELINKPFSHFETVILNDGVLLDAPVSEEKEEENRIEATSETAPADLKEPIEKEDTVDSEPIIPEETQTVEEQPEEQQQEEAQQPESTATAIEAPVAQDEIPVEEAESPVEEVEKTVDQPEASPAEERSEMPVSLPAEEKKSSVILWGVILALVLIILWGAYWLFVRPSTTAEIVPAAPIQQEINTTPKEEVPQDTLVPQKEAETVQPVSPAATTVPLQAPKNEKVPSLADTLDYQITGTKTIYTLQDGETIIKASVKFFGTKKFWPYIVKHNQDAIKDADNIPAGISIKIPELIPRN